MKYKQITALLCSTMLLGSLQSLSAGAVSLRPHDDSVAFSPAQTARGMLPMQYDLRKQGLTTRVQRQGSYGMCWSFSALAALESTIAAKQPAVDFSEWNLAYYTYSSVFGFPLQEDSAPTDAFVMGGNFYVVSPMLTSWMGPVTEESFPFGDMEVLDPDLTADSLRESAVYHVTDADLYLYEEYGQVTEEMHTAVKQSVYDGHAVSLSFYHHASGYNADTWSFYNAQDLRSEGNYHAVTVVGWDDTYPASNFLEDPGRDGAYLCKNSWGTTWGDGGYFWISYADPSIVELYSVRGEDAQMHTGQYLYDTHGYWTALSVEEADTTDYMANIFTAAEDTCVTSVMFVTALPGEHYTVRIYKDVQDAANPTSGTPCAETQGMQTYAGYHTVALEEPVFLKAGERFSVWVQLTGEPGQHIPCEAYTCFTTEYPDGTVDINETILSEQTVIDTLAPGESFYSIDGSEWFDTYDEEVIDLIAEDEESGITTSVYGRLGHVCVRALTQDIGRVTFSEYTEAVPMGTQIALTCPGAQAIWYTVNGSEALRYTDPITITEETELTAYAVLNGMTYPVQTQHYRLQNAQISTMLRTDTGEYLTFEQLSDDCYTALCTDIRQGCSLLPITTGQMTSKEGAFTSGERTEITAENAVTLRVSGEGQLDTTYVIYLTDVILGNVNLDKAVDASDAADVLIYAAGQGAGAAEEYDAAWKHRADCDADGTIDAADAAWILHTAAEQGAN